MSRLGRQFRTVEPPVESAVEGVEHGHAEDGDRQQSRHAGHRVVGAGSYAGAVGADGSHYYRRQRRGARRHSQTEQNYAREEGRPITSPLAWQRKQNEGKSHNQGADKQRLLRPPPIYQSPGPT